MRCNVRVGLLFGFTNTPDCFHILLSKVVLLIELIAPLSCRIVKESESSFAMLILLATTIMENWRSLLMMVDWLCLGLYNLLRVNCCPTVITPSDCKSAS